MSSSTAFQFGSFNFFCNAVALPLCPLVGDGVEPACYSRNIEVGGALIFEPATLVIHFVALVMTAIMIYHIKNKYTAVGRKEIVMFFYMYMACIVVDFFLISGIIPISSSVYQYFVALEISMIIATLWCLLLNGFVGFQWTEDGTPLSLWSIRLSSLVVLGLTYFVAIATFIGIGPFKASSPVALFVVFFAFGAAFVLLYYLVQIVLVVNTLEDRWPLGDITFGFFFFAVGQVMQYVFSKDMCTVAKHYIDGLFFGSVFTLLGVMMVYKYWDSITKEDLEFSVGGLSHVWEIRDPLLGDDAMAQVAARSQQQQQYGQGGQMPQQGQQYVKY
ncbi:chitin synthase III catalytic subunit [Cladochytrium replicatum]|nr:chitin synthase III catalytic subunit [Cladochytrium replicatum]